MFHLAHVQIIGKMNYGATIKYEIKSRQIYGYVRELKYHAKKYN